MYGNSMESFLFYNDKAWNRQYGGKNEWVNVQNAEQKMQSRKRHGKWQVVQIKLENTSTEIGLYECSKCGNVFREVLSKKKI